MGSRHLFKASVAAPDGQAQTAIRTGREASCRCLYTPNFSNIYLYISDKVHFFIAGIDSKRYKCLSIDLRDFGAYSAQFDARGVHSLTEMEGSQLTFRSPNR
jgi:hypothetical protein